MLRFVILFALSALLGNAQDISQSYGQFTTNLFKAVAKKPEPNIVVGPLSANLILALVQSGTRGATQDEFWSVLGLPHDEKAIESVYKTFIPTTRGNSDFQATISNRVYIARDFSVKSDFKNTAAEVFNASAENIDFTRSTEAVSKINQWVADETGGKIKDLLSTSDVSAMTALVLVNTVNFNATFARQFQANQTRKLDFRVNARKSVQIDTLQDHYMYYFAQDDVLKTKFLLVPLKGGEATIIFALPDDVDGLDALEAQIEKIEPNFQLKKVSVQLPKFKIESKLDLKEILQGLNLKRAFTRGAADLSGIAGAAGDLFIDKIIQKNYVSIDEKGVEAASATAAGVTPTVVPPNPEVSFHADHPFLFYIQVRGTTIFGGRVSDPSQ